MALKIILLVCFWPILPIVYLILRDEAKSKKNIILGVTLPQQAREDARVQAVCRSFGRSLGIVALYFCIVPPVTFWIRWSSIVFAVYMSWLFAFLAACGVVYIVCHRRLKAIKRAEGWGGALPQTVAVDTKVAAAPHRKINGWWFLPPFICSLLPVAVTLATQHGSEEFGWMLFGYGLNALSTGFFYCLGRIIYRQRSELVDKSSALSMALTQVRRYNWFKFCVASAWLTGVFSVLFWLTIGSTLWLLAVCGVYSAALLYFAIKPEFATRKAQQRLTAQCGGDFYIDEDANWIGGMLYYNPNDRHLMVNKRIGIGTTVNLARPAGKVVSAFCVLALLSMPVMGGWMMTEEFTPIRATVENGALVVRHTAQVFEIPLSDIESADLIDRLPATSKIVGSGLANLLKGSFNVQGYGRAELCLNPQQPPYMLLQTRDGPYLIGAGDSEQTRALYQMLERV